MDYVCIEYPGEGTGDECRCAGDEERSDCPREGSAAFLIPKHREICFLSQDPRDGDRKQHEKEHEVEVHELYIDFAEHTHDLPYESSRLRQQVRSLHMCAFRSVL